MLENEKKSGKSFDKHEKLRLVTEDGEFIATSKESNFINELRERLSLLYPESEYRVLSFFVRIVSCNPMSSVVVEWRKEDGYSLWRK